MNKTYTSGHGASTQSTRKSRVALRKEIAQSDLIMQLRGGPFRPIDPSQLHLPSVRSEESQVGATAVRTLEKRHKTQKIRREKYESKLREKEKLISDGVYEAVVPEHSQYEHVKSVHDKVVDIFQHTDSKVSEVVHKVTQIYNKKRSNKLDIQMDSDINKVYKNSIAYSILVPYNCTFTLRSLARDDTSLSYAYKGSTS